MTLLILSALIGPMTVLFSQANRTSFAADRLLEATVHGQKILDGLVALPLEELPPIGVALGGFQTLYDGSNLVPGGPRWEDEVRPFLESPTAFPGLRRQIEAQRVHAGQIEHFVFRVTLTWNPLPQRPQDSRSIVLTGQSYPRNWD